VTKKLFVSAQKLLDDSFQLGHKVLNDGFRPELIIGVWRGGAPIAIALQELFAYRGFLVNHYPVKVSSYADIEKQADEIDIQGMEDLVYIIANAKSILIVDDVFETGRTIQGLVDKIEDMLGENAPKVIRVATVFSKPGKEISNIRTDYFVHATQKWLVFPHELVGLTDEEVRENKPQALTKPGSPAI
jgi:hypoxanthine phosphoribosyltransferase